jgi:N-acetylmuramoyl-L-alanine amidase
MKYLIAISIALIILVSLFAGATNHLYLSKSFNDFKANLAAIFFVPSITVADLQKKFKGAENDNQKVRVLIMPGHEPGFGGTEFSSIKERDINVEIAKNLEEYLKTDSRFEVFVARDKEGWHPSLATYFKENWDEIKAFRVNQKAAMAQLISEGRIQKIVDGISHNSAPNDVAIRLFGINKWANENKIDIAIHLHINDYPRSPLSKAGKYTGFSIYVPEKQYSNAETTKVIADAVFKRLAKIFPTSNLPKEKVGIIEDQELVAIGQSNTMDGASLLIEYGYIYEPQFLNKEIREKVVREMALQTFLGLQDFFDTNPSVALPYESSLVPYIWKNDINQGVVNNLDILALQGGLTLQELYPPSSKTKNECPLSGNFGPCTESSLRAFQDIFNITDEKGRIGIKTREKLNQYFSGFLVMKRNN